MRFFTADTHFGHRNIIRFADRPYGDLAHMNVDLVNRVARAVGLGDELWHLGDVALGDLDSNLAHLSRVPVDVTLVAGNHDRCHPYYGAKSTGYIDLYRERCALTDLTLTNTVLELANGQVVNVSHFPYPIPSTGRAVRKRDSERPDKFSEWRPVDDGRWLLCGHVHGQWRQSGRMINVGVDAWAGEPVSEDVLVAMIEAGEQNLPPLPWGIRS